jgi:hypothetical protein
MTERFLLDQPLGYQINNTIDVRATQMLSSPCRRRVSPRNAPSGRPGSNRPVRVALAAAVDSDPLWQSEIC